MRLDERRLMTAVANYLFDPLVRTGGAAGVLRRVELGPDD